MRALLILFLNNLLPVFLAAGAGFLLSRRLQVNPRTLSRVIFYIFSPCLVFSLIVHSQLSNADILRMFFFAGLLALLVGLITWLAGRLLRLERRTMAAVLLTSIFMNAGNYGLPVLLFAFGETALAHGSLYFITSAVLTYTVGVMIASMGRASFTQAITNLAKIPAIYALVLAFLFLRAGWKLPLPLERTTTLLGDASIPSMLILLGMQFDNVQWAGNLVPLALANAMRMLVAPLLAIALSLAIGLQGPARQAGILESAMPAAVLTTVLATEYEVEPAFVTTVVIATTLFSPFTLTLLLAFLGG